MKAMFSVEEDGSVAAEIATESQGLLAEFVDFIKVGRATATAAAPAAHPIPGAGQEGGAG